MRNLATHRVNTQASGSAADRLDQCIDECNRCYEICLETVEYCLKLGGRYEDANHIRQLFDCAEACRTNASFMLRGSDLHRSTSILCAEACVRCELTCEQLQDDEQLRICAEVCRSCAEICEQTSMRL